MLKDYDKYAANADGVKIKSNFHTHNYLCGHAGGTVYDYVREAVKNGMRVIGISDHCVPPLDNCEPYITPATLGDEYLPQFDKARAAFGDKIEILSAVEIEYFAGNDGYYETLLDSLDYLVLGQHEYVHNGVRKSPYWGDIDERDVVRYCDILADGVRSGFFSVLAHPDLILYHRPRITAAVTDGLERVVTAAKSCGVAVELNANGIRSHGFRYPTDTLVELCKKHDAPVAVSSDAHSPDILCDEYMRGLYAYALAKGLNVVETINLPKKRTRR